jgi:cation transport regulator ChaC
VIGPVVTQPTWVFGYGSLIWKQDFPYIQARDARITGWARRFCQGSHDHRGTEEAPGRVVTLTRAPAVVCHGRAFCVAPDVFDHLDHREKNGYERLDVEIDLGDRHVSGVFYRGVEGNFAFLGDAPMQHIAEQIHKSIGPSGANVDYLLELAEALRSMKVEFACSGT